jgi:hypothetical protein
MDRYGFEQKETTFAGISKRLPLLHGFKGSRSGLELVIIDSLFVISQNEENGQKEGENPEDHAEP